MIYLKKVILWSNNDEIREVAFNTSGITVLIGDGTVGKSALVSIIDYCLGSSKCEIPIGVTRNKCSWYGVQLLIDNEDYLIARKVPKGTKSSDEMFLLEMDDDTIPHELKSNKTKEELLLFFNTHFKLTNLNISSEENGKSIIPSYRDTIAINFYPQELLLDKNFDYYKQSSEHHNKRLKALFPYILGLESMEVVLEKTKLQSLKQELKVLERKKEKEKSILKDWETECHKQLLTAVKLGIIGDETLPTTFYEQLTMLKLIEDRLINDKIVITKNTLEKLNREISNLEGKKDKLESSIFANNERLRMMKKQKIEVSEFERDIENSDSVKLSSWIKNDFYLLNQISGAKDSYAKSIYERIVNTIEEEEKSISYFNYINTSLDKEMMELENLLENDRTELNSIKSILLNEYKSSKEILLNYTSLKQVYSYLGNVQTYIKMYDKLKENTALDQKLKTIADEIIICNKKLEHYTIDKESFEIFMNATLYELLGTLSAEYSTKNQIFFNSKNMSLSIKDNGVVHEKKNVGSGANHVQYHIVLALLLQIYIQNKVKNKITFDFLVFDQASEAFFPSREENINEKMMTAKNNKTDDYIRLHGLYETLAYTHKRHCPQTQIIVLEHAGREYWENSEGKLFTESIEILDWKDSHEKLVPEHWKE